MSSQRLMVLGLLTARLSRRIVLWVFVSIITIEAIILVPSYFQRERELLQQLEEVSKEVVEGVVRFTQQNTPDIFFEDKVQKLIIGSDIILGVAIYKSDEQLMGIFGEPPQISFSDLKRSKMMQIRRWNGQRYDVAWSSHQLGVPYVVIIRHNASFIQPKLYAFTLRIAGLVLLISVFVTGTTMLVLGRIVIVPILQLRNDLIAVGEAISQDKPHPSFYSLSVQPHDELGEVMAAFNQMFERVSWEIAQRKQAEVSVRAEQEKSERLLLNILPEPIAKKLKQNQNCIADGFAEVTILFADIVGFTQLASQISPTELVNLLNEIFSAFDRLTEKHGLEKIKTIGDAYMVAGGLPMPRSDHAEAIADMALDMQQDVRQFNDKHGAKLNIRIGINTGPVVAGVIGTKKFIYDLWGDAVNTASRMESHGIAGAIQVSLSTYELLKNRFELKERGAIPIKGKGEMTTYLLIGRKSQNLISG
ncbi:MULTISPECIES: adenylate/guanylate cyclase domain-containing protein [unclassified Coleofasciculus]|uniref:adenylate/guanylate cyclase domain-containing protein n=1 Tax=unclassified Coleofasciculus TaxID=2692782 RepID=UPI00187EB6D0|nr:MULTISPECIES: adenylate/guanylate cyclase domain-containing protein [unclassified Coleofasciculus]MBE9130021.1 adenylate/guanylate cyclase domain-containing protein [Coleofasciculus sp. LEGE 07081]MBE9147917.1 adenylate/guanylate cyclase domain-containing protein [Coleofasciculus sp. LEGE 07092]